MFDPAQTTADPAPHEVDQMLAEMAQAGQAAIERVGVGSVPSVKPPKIRYTHEAMADLILQNPWISQNQLAAHFGYSPGWISTVITSDAFQAFLHSRQAELVDPELRATLEERLRALTAQSLRVLQEKVSQPFGQVPDQLALRAAELGIKGLGLGVAPPPPAPPDPGKYLPELAERLMRLGGLARQQPVSEAVILQDAA